MKRAGKSKHLGHDFRQIRCCSVWKVQPHLTTMSVEKARKSEASSSVTQKGLSNKEKLGILKARDFQVNKRWSGGR